ncbi:MAG TPA: sugar ABC transporter permease [Bacilli bacterium]
MNKAMRNPLVYILFVLPAIILYFMFFIYPFVTSGYYSFFDWDGLQAPKYIGFQNFIRLFHDEDFRLATINNLYFILFSVFIQVPLIVFFSLLISSVKKFQSFYKTTVFMPSVISTSVIGILWGFIYHPDMGLLNNFLGLFGIGKIYWLSDLKTALLSVLITNAWQWMGFYIVLILAAILAIPKELSEAAAIDGANGFQKATKITVPLIMPVISVVIMLSIAGAMRVVDIILVMTNGGPAGATDVMASYMVTKAINFGMYGYGNAIAIVIFVFAMVLTALYQILIARKIERNEF